MEVVEGTTRYYPPLPYKRYNVRLPFGLNLFYHKDAWSLDIQLLGPWRKVGTQEYPQIRKQIDIAWWKRYNTLYGKAWRAIVLGVQVWSSTARRARKGVG